MRLSDLLIALSTSFLSFGSLSQYQKNVFFPNTMQPSTTEATFNDETIYKNNNNLDNSSSTLMTKIYVDADSKNSYCSCGDEVYTIPYFHKHKMALVLQGKRKIFKCSICGYTEGA